MIQTTATGNKGPGDASSVGARSNSTPRPAPPWVHRNQEDCRKRGKSRRVAVFRHTAESVAPADHGGPQSTRRFGGNSEPNPGSGVPLETTFVSRRRFTPRRFRPRKCLVSTPDRTEPMHPLCTPDNWCILSPCNRPSHTHGSPSTWRLRTAGQVSGASLDHSLVDDRPLSILAFVRTDSPSAGAPQQLSPEHVHSPLPFLSSRSSCPPSPSPACSARPAALPRPRP